ncbi:peptidase M56 family protein [Arthrobacter sp. TMN-37]
MNLDPMDDTFGQGLRAVLVSRVNASSPADLRRHRWWVRAGVFAGVGLVGGAGAAAAAFLVEPGGDIVTALATADEGVYTGSQAIELGQAPPGATHITMELTCLSAGTLYWEDGASMSCGPNDLEARGGYTIALNPGERSTGIRTSEPDVRYRLEATYVNKAPTEWAVNENGDTYGTAKDHREPVLLAVIASSGVHGYAYSEELDEASGRNAAEKFASPAEALAWQEARLGKTFAVPVYESDGETVIGEFIIEGPPDLRNDP